jgi:hypothetical protein
VEAAFISYHENTQFVIREFDVKQILRGYNAYYSRQLLIPDIQLFIQIFFEENILYFQ